MKKWKVIVLSLVIASFTVPVNASESYYKLLKVNYPILVDNENLVSNNPVLNYSGTTYLSIRDIANATQSKIDWDNINKKIIINTIKEEIKPTVPAALPTPIIIYKTNQNDISLLKLYSDIQNFYKWLYDNSLFIIDLSDVSSLAFDGITLNNSTGLTETFFNGLNNQIDFRNEMLEPAKKIIDKAKSYSIDISDINTILNNQYNSLEFYKKVYDSLSNYYQYNNQNYFEDYLYNKSKAFDEISKAREKSSKKYFEYYNLIQNYICE